MPKKIPVSNGRFFAIVDDEDYDFLMQWRWVVGGTRYVARGKSMGKVIDDKNGCIYMHRLIAKTPDGMHTDHINGDRLDNRKENLRICNRSENLRNSGKTKNITTSKYKGVYWSAAARKWASQISIDGIQTHLGLSISEDAAARKYNEAAIEHYGEFARLNELAP